MKPFMGNVERGEETAGKRRGKVGKLRTDEEEDRRQDRREATLMVCAVTPCSLRILLSPANHKEKLY